MHPQNAVWVEVDVELDAVRAQFDGTREGGEGVLRALTGGTAVGDDFGAGHSVS